MVHRPITQQQELFCREYLVDCNASAAAVRAGYSTTWPATTGSRLLRKSTIQARLAELREAHWAQLDMTAVEVRGRMAQMIRTNLPGIVKFDGSRMSLTAFADLSDAQQSVIRDYRARTVTVMRGDEPVEVDQVEVHLVDKTKLLADMGRFCGLGLRVDTGDSQRPVEINLNMGGPPNGTKRQAEGATGAASVEPAE